ncbi:MAG: tRNA lysidine(34) synthetase TilS [Verrucomicrobia bacterium]|nr:tRNA lysidine(34) synthetase TilS [Verrucomicrobiota bacterium]
MNLLLPPDCSPETRFLLGISGGRDSVALLEALWAAGYRHLILCHLNHQLRGSDSDGDAAFVADLARAYGLEAEIGSGDVRALAARARISIELAARRARLSFFKECAARHDIPRVLLAHHAGDQVETILMRLLRGTGRKGLGGMRPVARLGGLILIRPFLQTRRDHLPLPARFREDASNATDLFLRNRLRNRAIPVLREAFGRDFTEAVGSMAEVLREEERLLEQWAGESLRSLGDGGNGLDAKRFRALPVALQRRVLLGWMSGAGVPGIGFRHVEAARQVGLGSASPAKVNLPGDWHLRRRAGSLLLDPPSPGPSGHLGDLGRPQ